MGWTTFFIALFIMVALFDIDLFWSIIILVVINALMSNVEVTSTNDITVELNKIKIQIDNAIKDSKDSKVLLPPPKDIKAISINRYDDINRVYIGNDKRSYDEVQMKSIAGKTYACTADDTCITEPIMKRHIDNVLYACNDSICYQVK